jgi:hypothetical protein
MFKNLPPEIAERTSTWSKIEPFIGIPLLVGVPLIIAAWVIVSIDWGGVWTGGGIFSPKHVLATIGVLMLFMLVVGAVMNVADRHRS